ncbi:MAG: thiamine biosynthesis protein ThiS [Chloroflexi bacterium]|nr:thiamine biosynthesis protein ThiS [Chloroflexota bacterium]|tara:strand:+ start:298 stop:504 length:207 start_codon:yes stop_codon:yes gene_type:complete
MLMKIKVNGKTQSFDQSVSISDLINHIKLSNTSIAIALNGKIIHQNEYHNTKLKNMDSVEIVRPVGGG